MTPRRSKTRTLRQVRTRRSADFSPLHRPNTGRRPLLIQADSQDVARISLDPAFLRDSFNRPLPRRLAVSWSQEDWMQEIQWVSPSLGYNPNGIASFSPGLRRSRYPGSSSKSVLNPEGLLARYIHLLTTSAKRTQS